MRDTPEDERVDDEYSEGGAAPLSSGAMASAGLAALRVLHRRVGSWKHERLMSVVVTDEVRRSTVLPTNLNDLGRLVVRTDHPAVHVQPVTYYCAHGNSSRRSSSAACTFPRVGGRGRQSALASRTHRGLNCPVRVSVTAPIGVGTRNWLTSRGLADEALVLNVTLLSFMLASGVSPPQTVAAEVPICVDKLHDIA